MYVSLQCPSQTEIQKLLRKKQGEEDDYTEDWPSGDEALWKPGEADWSTGDGKVVNWIKHCDSPQFPSPPSVKLNELINW